MIILTFMDNSYNSDNFHIFGQFWHFLQFLINLTMTITSETEQHSQFLFERVKQIFETSFENILEKWFDSDLVPNLPSHKSIIDIKRITQKIHFRCSMSCTLDVGHYTFSGLSGNLSAETWIYGKIRSWQGNFLRQDS